MEEIIIRTGLAGAYNRIRVEWFDHNNVMQSTVIDVDVDKQDKPRMLDISINGVWIACVLPNTCSR